MQFGLPYGINNKSGIPQNSEIKNILNFAKENGISFLDTANAYGEAQVKTGLLNQNRFNIIGKFSAVNSHDELNAELRKTLSQLKTTSIYGYLAHNADNLIANIKLWDVLKQAKSENKIKKIGYSLYHTEQLEKLLSMNLIPDLVQLPFSLLDRKFEPYFEILKNMGTEIHVRSVFLQGLYFMDPLNLPKKLQDLKPSLIQLHQICKEQDIEINSLALNYPLLNSFIDKVVIGIDNVSQLKKNLQAIHEGKFKSFLVGSIEKINGQPNELLNPANW